MNSKFTFFLFTLFTMTACGVKAPPLKHPQTIIDSYTQEYTGPIEPATEEQQNKAALPSK